ncbi:flagellar hook-basal body complex protein FliE [Vibrio xiamenensis]|uniref:Flagellar hook-basal body complex protein FliE n=1 Tax=Vibrio xiamenensis TaxID=861298 RepID=A0A1G7ZZL7_9VIBR|nr:flagellar hook-basal body complex protein FliE [Vibrio xiamenensis]SDH13610.1 flagellar hook-basal body complex protein FliE [Vibrio xiamenensis]
MDIQAISAVEQSMLDRLNQNQAITSNPVSQFSGISETPVGNSVRLDFGSTLKGIFDTVDAHQKTAEAKITAVELGQSDDLIGATVAAQKAQLSFSALMQVRNKMVTNFNDIIKMPV